MSAAEKIETKTQQISLARFLPILGWLPEYERTWLRADLIAGLTVVALLIPEGMAYAEIAGVPPQAAFYAAPIGLLLFAIFGSSRQMVVAVSAAIAAMSYATVSLIAQPNTPHSSTKCVSPNDIVEVVFMIFTFANSWTRREKERN